ncbi:tripartite tricarboxylate transporter TctB family protein [Geopsychrobacter electrodiphilus]|uniref:tripartite tricarboxylate transporter TctB family protein n=1 Tax=Geopsychrobacter electrodiphilus TaxID=225196 RepID=UPI00037FD263|nr:tripartite tricarboxylate transporter TctB family protein [Geopsychrobacter electrodiphilus]
MSDRIFGVLLLLLAADYSWTARGFDPGFMADPLGPQTFPYLLGAVLAVTALYLLLRPDPTAHWPDLPRLLQLGLVILVLLAYASLLEWLGFLIATLLTVTMLGWRLGASLRTAILTGIGVSLVVYGLFDIVLELPLPAGLLGRF